MKKYNGITVFRVISIALLALVAIMSVFVLNHYEATVPVAGAALPVCSVDVDIKEVALTFDCTSLGEETKEIIRILESFNVEGSFFVTGENVKDHEDVLLRLWSGGHDIGNMTYSYNEIGNAGTNVIKGELKKCNDVIEEITGTSCVLFRAPYDHYGKKTVKTAAVMGMYSIRHDIDALTWKPEIYKEGISDRFMDQVKPGSILMFKADGRYTKEILKETITRLIMDGYRPVKVTELIYKDQYTVNVNGVQISSK